MSKNQKYEPQNTKPIGNVTNNERNPKDTRTTNTVRADETTNINGNTANHWLNTIILDSRLDRDEFLKMTNDNNVMTRPIWTLMSKLPMFKDCQTDGLENSLWLEDRVVNIPSSVPDGALKKLDKQLLWIY